ncbi:MAG: hypothetical protein U9P90_03325 [Patescibacteria group bacterium]|nr:hypothetical protein [Patescibacteria group bacterium]
MNNFRALAMSFAEVRERFPELVVCGPKEVSEIFEGDVSGDSCGFSAMEIVAYLKQLREDFGEENSAVGLFQMPSFLKIVYKDDGGNYEKMEPPNLEMLLRRFSGAFNNYSYWAEGEDFSLERMRSVVILTALESNPVFHGRKYDKQQELAEKRGEEIISAVESAFTLCVAGKRYKRANLDRTNTTHEVLRRGVHHERMIGVGDNDTKGIKVIAYGHTALMNMGATAALVRKI